LPERFGTWRRSAIAVDSRVFVGRVAVRVEGTPGAFGVDAAEPSMVRSNFSAVAVMRSP
jgi:hypothetical protein